MQKLFICCLLFFFCSTANASITVSIISPTQNQAQFYNTIHLSVDIYSDYDLKSVVATLNGQKDTLSSDINSIGSYTSDWVLNGMPTNTPLTLTITAIDYFNNQQSSSVVVVFVSPPPVVNKPELPVMYSNIYPSVHLKGSYTGGDSVTFTVSAVADYSQIFSFVAHNNIDTIITINLKTIPQGTVYITYTATDKWGQHSDETVYAFYDDNVLLKKFYEGKGDITDFNYDKVLEGYSSYQITDLSTSVSTPLPSTFTGTNVITPYGVLSNTGNLFDWNTRKIYSFPNVSINNPDTPAYAGGSARFNNSGKYATSAIVFENYDDPYSAYIDIYLNNLETHTSTFYARSRGNNYYYIPGENFSQYDVDNAVDSSGYVEYVDNPILIDEGYELPPISMHPATDNYNHAYMWATPVMNTDGAFTGLYNDTLIINHSTAIGLGVDCDNYRLENKFIAYEKKGPSGVTQIWLRDSLGNNTQLTYSGTVDSYLRSLNPQGDIIYTTGTTGYLAKKGTTSPIQLGNLSGVIYYRDSAWYESKGNTLYKLLVDAYLPVTNGDWNNPATWQNNTVPPANADVIINNFTITVTANASCNSLKMVSPGNVTVLPGVNLTVLH
ncbi:hypothetical protein [Ferruginibacter albus]|uniref:hypothetical protein n=1 Tax=Ferruginibacter albus TaxID=2875540 RepID=UPI001CC4F23B|nr:hypothetical protein [Ferruginibacter albus]UAY51188.1 hypothetical protein K9M53_11375 [Ferruginibacter albus]